MVGVAVRCGEWNEVSNLGRGLLNLGSQDLKGCLALKLLGSRDWRVSREFLKLSPLGQVLVSSLLDVLHGDFLQARNLLPLSGNVDKASYRS